MRRIILMSSAAVVLPFYAWAETSNSVDEFTCTVTPDCQSLGYTETACADNNGVKCPWGDTWFCPVSEAEICEKNGFVYDCKATNQIGGAGKDCHGKFGECSCDRGYKWENNGCVETYECIIGSIFYSDKTCSMGLQTDKTPIGVVVYTDGTGGGQAMALKSIGQYSWLTAYNNISTLPDLTSEEQASQDFASCENTKIIMAAGDNNKYPAAWKAYEYSTEGTYAGDWCLPAAGIFTSYYNNQNIINNTLKKIGGSQLTPQTYAWSSSEYDSTHSWHTNFYGTKNYGIFYGNHHRATPLDVHPVLEF